MFRVRDTIECKTYAKIKSPQLARALCQSGDSKLSAASGKVNKALRSNRCYFTTLIVIVC